MSLLKFVCMSTVAALVAGCAGIPYNRSANNDATPPDIGLHVEGQRPDSTYKPNPDPSDTPCLPKKSDFCPNIRITPIDVGAQVLGTPRVAVQIHENGEASVLANAQDSGSGIQSIKLRCQRMVYYN